MSNLKESDTALSAKEVCRKYGIGDKTYYNWKRKRGWLEVSKVWCVRELEAENVKLKRMYVDLNIENLVLRAGGGSEHRKSWLKELVRLWPSRSTRRCPASGS